MKIIASIAFALILIACAKEDEVKQPIFTGTLEVIFTQDKIAEDTMAVRAEITFDQDLNTPLAKSENLDISGDKTAKWVVTDLNYGNYYLRYERWRSNISGWGTERIIPVQVRANSTSRIVLEI